MLSDFTQKIQGHYSYTRFLKYSITLHIFLLGNYLENVFSASYETFLAWQFKGHAVSDILTKKKDFFLNTLFLS